MTQILLKSEYSQSNLLGFWNALWDTWRGGWVGCLPPELFVFACMEEPIFPGRQVWVEL